MPAPRARPWPWRLLRGLLLGLAALLLALGQWGWEPLVAALGRLARWPPWARLEGRIARLPPRFAAAVFLAPSLLLVPVKLMALWAIERGHPLIGLAVVLLAKAAGTALVGRLFVLTEPQLVQLRWFARALAWWRATQAPSGPVPRASCAIIQVPSRCPSCAHGRPHPRPRSARRRPEPGAATRALAPPAGAAPAAGQRAAPVRRPRRRMVRAGHAHGAPGGRGRGR
ncbi:hypothetical protein [Piscinibacter sakaiensis]|uniref:hypothetical protein n=1 Tax=Piscinibacter sakaiensis TaxID=1547922 RepID=UPI00372D4A03